MRGKLLAHFLSCSQTLPCRPTKQLHALLITTQLSLHSSLTVKLLRSYAASGDIVSARRLFDQAPNKTVVLWNSIIRSHARLFDFCSAFSLLSQMRRSGANPDNYTLACILRACADSSDANGARATHGALISSGLDCDRIAGSALISAYSKLGLVHDAGQVFDEMLEPDVVCWNSVILGYGHAGFWQKGLEMFCRMRGSGEMPDGYSLVALVSCFCDPSVLLIGKGIHGFCLKAGHDSSAHVCSALLSMYSRCGCLESGCRIFRALASPDLVTWSSFITGFSQVGKYREALSLFREMACLGRTLDPVLIASLLSACASMAKIEPAKEIHCYVFRHGMHPDLAVSCALMDSYAKCGFAERGIQVFQMISKKNLVIYNTLISCLGSHGLGREAICVFEGLLREGLRPDGGTFSAVLSSCCHSGLLEDGWRLFRKMKHEFGIEAQIEHYVYMVKLLGMAGMVKEAYDLILTISMPPDSGVWGALLWACNSHGLSDLGEVAARRLLKIDPGKPAYRIMLSNLYAEEQKWGNVQDLRHEMVEEGLKKIPGLSWV